MGVGVGAGGSAFEAIAWQPENSEVSVRIPPTSRVAVAVSTSPAAEGLSVAAIVASPAPFVVTSVEPRNVRPSPLPEASQAAFVKNSTR